MEVTATEFKKKMGRYIDLSQHEDVFIRRNGRIVSRLTSPYQKKRAIVESLVGVLPPDFDAEAALDERRAAI